MNIASNSRNGCMPQFLWLLVILLAVACGKKDYTLTLPPEVPGLPDINKKLTEIPSFRLFNLALQKARLSEELHSNLSFTIFAISDADMQAAGLTEVALNNLSPGRLKTMFAYHIVLGAFPETMLASTTGHFGAKTLRQDVSFSEPRGYKVFKQYLYCTMRNNRVFLNGAEANRGEPVHAASNGFIYTVSKLVTAPEKSMYEEIRSRPELFFYAESLRIIDSMYQAAKIANFPKRLDSTFMNTTGADFQNLHLYFSGSTNNVLSVPTVFAPVNDAYVQAGFNSVQDIRNFCYQTTAAQIRLRKYVNLDSVLKTHVVFNSRDRFYNFLFTYDMLNEPNLNNGIHNTSYYSILTNTNYPANPVNNKLVDLSVSNGDVFIRPLTNPNLTPAKVLSSGKDIQTMNGILHEVDRLLYPLFGN